jgi:hypothetical protein
MGLLYWKGLENVGFRERTDGDWDYFPRGIWGRGYRVTAVQRAELRQAMRPYYKAFVFAVVALVLAQALIVPLAGELAIAAFAPLTILAILAIVPWSIVWRTRRRRILGDAPPAESRLTLAEVQQTKAEHISEGQALLLLITGPFMTLGAAVALIGAWRGGGDMETLGFALAGILFSGVYTWSGVGIWRRRQRFLAQGGHAAKVFD